jgi:acetyltransferase-like isoleucine patch superfamily enzyme
MDNSVNMFKKIIFLSYKAPLFLLRKISNLFTTLVYKFCLKSCGKGIRIEFGAKISNPWNVTIGDNVSIGRGAVITTELPNSHLIIEDNVQINSNVFLDYTGGVKLRTDAFISADSIIYTHSHGIDPRSLPIPLPLVIESGAWIGRGVFISHSVKYIGAKSLIGAQAVLTKDTPNNSIFVGNPANQIKK